ncbi:aminotransferase class V-fold PLP-dependent enzyme [Streptomyces sp. NPDC050658]|uniref:aminotransferase class V-fold PLP-dependent enzyme n=1 Tax=unclassified Streptomyces TaxID=2593676 RepID=UPI00341EAFDE
MVDWNDVRREFALDLNEAHFTCCFLATLPTPVRAAVERFRSAVAQNVMWAEQEFFGVGPLYHRVLRALSHYTGGSPDQIALTSSTTSGLAAVYNGLRLKPTDEVVVTVHDHGVHQEVARMTAARFGARCRLIRLYDHPRHATADEAAERLLAEIGPRTRVVGLPWVDSRTGVKLPLALIAEVVSGVNRSRSEQDHCLSVVDGVQGLGVEDVDVARSGIDFFVAGTHKWMLAPSGTGFVWGASGAWSHLMPSSAAIIPDIDRWTDYWSAHESGRPSPSPQAHWFSPGGFQAIEHRLAMADAVAFHEAIGRKQISDRILHLNAMMREELKTVEQVKLLTPEDTRMASGLVCFHYGNDSARSVLGRLAEAGVYGTVTPDHVRPAVRLAAGLMNTPEQVTRVSRLLHEGL